MPDYIFQMDLIFGAILTFLLGGTASEAYVVFLVVIAYSSVENNLKRTIRVTSSSVVYYSVACIMDMIINLSEFHFTTLIVRSILFGIFAYALVKTVGRVKKYNFLHKKEFQLARTDKLTGLPNRHYLEQTLEQEVKRCEEHGETLSILIFDLDNFKKFNDTYGHVWGDKLLEIFGEILADNVRMIDTPVRYGGEEFMILIKNLDIGMAKSVGDRVRRELEKEKILIKNDEGERLVTVSCGVAQYPTHSDNIKESIDLADKALYYAKEHGKNVVVGYDDVLLIKKYEEEILAKQQGDVNTEVYEESQVV
jgi:diguanylate cyclase (GGDEF)-like protein